MTENYPSHAPTPPTPESANRVGREPLERLTRYAGAIASTAREVTKTVVIVVYLLVAFWLLLTRGEPEGFLVLIPWALRTPAGRGRR